MKIVKALSFLLIFAFLGIITTISIQAQQMDALPFEVIGQNDVRSGWSGTEPSVAIIANPNELTRFRNWVYGNDYSTLNKIDYDSSFAVAVFHGLVWGPQDSQTVAVNVEQIYEQDNNIHITATSTLIPLEGDPAAISPYQIIRIDKEGEWGEERTFALQLDDKDVVTKTHYIPSPYLLFETVDSGGGEGESLWESEEVGTIVAATPEELSALQSLVTTDTMQILQAVDYDKQLVVGLFQGLQSTAGYSIEIEQIRHQLGNIEIKTLLTEPTENVPTVITSPYHVVKLDKMSWWNQELTFTVLSNEMPILTQTHTMPNNDVEFEWVASGGEYWWEGDIPGLIVINTIRDAKQLKTLVDIESIDFSDYFVIAQFYQFNSGGYSISMNRVRYEENRIFLYHNISTPFIGDRVTNAIEPSYQIIKIRRSAREWNSETDIEILFNGATRLTQPHTILPPSEMATLEKNTFSSGWRSPEPHMEIIRTVGDILRVEEFISTETLATLQEIDYQEKYAAIVFQGEKTSTKYEIEIEQIRRSGNQVIFDSVAKEPLPDELVGHANTSPYHLVQIDNLYERGRQIDFALNINGQHIMTQTRSIPDMLSQPSTLQGNFYPLTDRVGYEIVLENQGQQTAENVRLFVQTEYDGVEYTDDWNCDEGQIPQECRQDLGDLSAGQIITRTFSFNALPLPLMRSVGSCDIRVEFEEPVVSAWADNMSIHYLSGTGESVFDSVVPGQPCPERLTYLPLISR